MTPLYPPSANTLPALLRFSSLGGFAGPACALPVKKGLNLSAEREKLLPTKTIGGKIESEFPDVPQPSRGPHDAVAGAPAWAMVRPQMSRK
jgi:hypothetical protein